LAPWRVEAVVSGGRRLLAAQVASDVQDDMHIVIAVAAEAFGVAQADILSTRRARQIVRARQTAMYLAHVVVGYAAAQIASAFERDYTSVLHAIRKLEHAIVADPAIASAVSVMR
jgi:chromosomal replication initiation ATPase DnaA